MTLRKLMEEGTALLLEAGIADPACDAGILLLWAYDLDRTQYLVKADEESDDPLTESVYKRAIMTRSKHTPVQYITGRAPFYGMEFAVSPDVLIPRFDTEILVEEAVRRLKSLLKEKERKLSVLDMCTGSGCIAISVAAALDCEMTAVDLSQKALDMAALNERVLLDPERNGALKHTPSPIRFLQSNMFEAVSGEYDCILSNPPYIRPEVIETLDIEVKDREPRLALDGGPDGLDFYRILAREAGPHLRKGGLLLMEIGCDQAQAVTQLLTEYAYAGIEVVKDLAGLDRVIAARRN